MLEHNPRQCLSCHLACDASEIEILHDLRPLFISYSISCQSVFLVGLNVSLTTSLAIQRIGYWPYVRRSLPSPEHSCASLRLLHWALTSWAARCHIRKKCSSGLRMRTLASPHIDSSPVILRLATTSNVFQRCTRPPRKLPMLHRYACS